MAMQYGIFSANYPLTDEELESAAAAVLGPHKKKLHGLTLKPERLQQIRNERRPAAATRRRSKCNTSCVPRRRCSTVSGADLDVTECSIEEIASRIMDQQGIPRHARS